MQLRHGRGELDGRLPPDGEAETNEAVERAPHYLGCSFVPVGRSITRIQSVKRRRATYDSANAPKEWGIKRGALKRTVEHVTW